MRRAARCTARGTRSCGRRAVRGGEARLAVVTRSTSDASCRVADEQPGHGPAHPAPASRTLGHGGSRSATAHDPHDRSSSAQRAVPVGQDAGAGDRKSTRLNSSHLVISYAVFCLKKKKKNNCKNHIY